MLLKVGDKAVVYANTSDHYFNTGDVVVILEVKEDAYFAIIESEADAYKAGDIDFIDTNGWFVNDDDVFAYVEDAAESDLD